MAQCAEFGIKYAKSKFYWFGHKLKFCEKQIYFIVFPRRAQGHTASVEPTNGALCGDVTDGFRARIFQPKDHVFSDNCVPCGGYNFDATVQFDFLKAAQLLL